MSVSALEVFTIRSLLRNQQPVFFKLYEGKEEIVDEYGNATGSFIPIYSNLKSAMLCVSPNKGNSEVEQFGTFADYDRTMTTADTSFPIDENTVLWVDGADTSGPWNFIVKKVAPWKNSVQYAIQQVTVSQYQETQKVIAEAVERKRQVEAAKAAAVSENAENQAETE
jgi:hypothetical protein